MGTVKWIGVKKGDVVTNGQVVVTLDGIPATLVAQVDRAQAMLLLKHAAGFGLWLLGVLVAEEPVEEPPVEEPEPIEEEPAPMAEGEEHGGPKGREPTRYGDWENKGICWDF